MANFSVSSSSPASKQATDKVNFQGYIDLAVISVIPKEDVAKAMLSTQKILNDSLLMNRLCDRVYELMLQDLSQQKERLQSYGRLLSW